ncbi:hypothetical protein PsorP6_007867 [Peronosclerospora sorghi]|uniref:Uncharacterized protein n=1 Tax=Peronosclerospora sorghi TaxID=230839 RepID=A0ACC0W8G1_9STRA|nr:hypothetical protein PsorP6_007867 [Peronosclerospora sorghi]
MIAITSSEDFHNALTAATEKPLVAFFSSPLFEACERLAPKMATLADELEASAAFVVVNAEKLNSLCEELEVDVFPHFRVYKDGKILGDHSSTKFDNISAFIRELVAPDTLYTYKETPESTTEETTSEKESDAEAAADDGSRKRQERDDMASNDEHVVKKIKTDVEAAGGIEKEKAAEETNVVNGETVEVPEELPEEVTKTDETPEAKEKQLDDSTSIDQVESREVTAASDAVAA